MMDLNEWEEVAEGRSLDDWSILFISPLRVNYMRIAQHKAQLSRQSSNCLSLVSSSPGDIPDLDLCPVQLQNKCH